MARSMSAGDTPYATPSQHDTLPYSLEAPPTYPYQLSRRYRETYQYTGGEYELTTDGDYITVRFTGFLASENGLNQFLPVCFSIPAGSYDTGRWVMMISPKGCISVESGFNCLLAGSYQFPVTTYDPAFAGTGSNSLTLTFPPGFTTSQLSDIWNIKYTRIEEIPTPKWTIELWKDGDEGNKTTNEVLISNPGDPVITPAKLVVGNVEGLYPSGTAMSYLSVTRCTLLEPVFSVA